MVVIDLEVLRVAKAYKAGMTTLNRSANLSDLYTKWLDFKRTRPRQWPRILKNLNTSLSHPAKTARRS